MSRQPPRVATVTIILDPTYGRQLLDLPLDGPVWIVDSPENCGSARRAASEIGMDLTTYKCPISAARLANLRDILYAVELHYGRLAGNYLALDSGTLVRVIGLNPTDDVVQMVGELGFGELESSSDGFVATKGSLSPRSVQ